MAAVAAVTGPFDRIAHHRLVLDEFGPRKELAVPGARPQSHGLVEGRVLMGRTNEQAEAR
ncbi:hypothetical protein ACIPWE_24665 [Streptomyces sp. NPDC090073]|uniref:hypothetical protein n=1 Tax=Streptomyces sp. NPDC090073 TaxID=3365936 RepID=UPI00380DC4C3